MEWGWGKTLFKGDKYLWIIIIVLIVASVMLVYSSSSRLAYDKQHGDLTYYILRHSFFLVLSIVVLVVTCKIEPMRFAQFSIVGLIVGVATVWAVLFIGKDINGSSRWISIGAFSFQPSEIAKVALVVFVAKVLALHTKNPKEAFWPIIIASALVCFPILIENLSTALLIGTTIFLMMIIGCVPTRYILGIVTSVVLVGVVLLYLPGQFQPKRFETWKGRIERFMNEDEEGVQSKGKNYQALQAELAVANGGVFGVGPGKSYAKNFLPMAFSDFIYSIILEEYGWVGGFVAVALYFFILYRAMVISRRCEKAFQAYLVLGLSILIVLQAIINMSVGVWIIPVT